MKAEKIVEILKLCEPGLAKSAYEIEDNAKDFIFSDGLVASYNGVAWVTVGLDLGLHCCLPGDELYKFLNSIKGEVKIIQKAEKVIFKSGRTRAEFKSKIVDEKFEEGLRDVKLKRKYKKLPKDFEKALGMCIFSIAKDATIKALSCVSLKGNLMITSDDQRVTEYQMTEKMPTVLIPGKVCRDLLRYNFTEYSVDSSWIYFRDGEVVFACRLHSGEYVETEGMFDFMGSLLKIPAEKVRAAIDIVSCFVSDELQIDSFIEVEIDGDNMKLVGEGDVGMAENSVKLAKGVKKEIKFKINPNFLREILSRVDKLKIGEDRALFSLKNFRHLIALSR